MKLTDLLPLEKWIELEEDLHKRSGLDVNIFNTDGVRISEFKVWVNRLCPVVKADDRGQSFICAVAHMNIAEIARQAKKPVIEECDAGLVKLVVPIFVDDEFIGAVGACGLILDDGEVDSFMVNKTIDLEEDEIESLSNDIGQVTTEELEVLGKYIQERISAIVIDMKSLSRK